MLVRSSLLTFLLTGVTVVTAADPADRTESTQWLGFRGDTTSASASAAPEYLSLGDDANLAWKQAMPGRSVAGPIIVGDLVVTTGSSGQNGERMHVSGVDLFSGELLWQQTFRATGRPFCHPTSANAAPTPASDGTRIVAFFSSNDLVCLSTNGDLRWYRGLGYDYPKTGNDVGMAASPVIADGVVVVQVECQGDSFAVGIDLESGSNLWRLDRPRKANWSSPVAIRRPDQRTEVILQSSDGVLAVDPRTGRQTWDSGEGGSTIESATVAGGLLLVPGGGLTALDFAASATTPHVAWANGKLAPKNASAVATNERIYSLKGSVLVAASIKDGEEIWKQRLSGIKGTWATPVVAGGKLYVFDQNGIGQVIEDQGDNAETLSEVDLGEAVLASPAVAKGRLVVRAERTLYCFE